MSRRMSATIICLCIVFALPIACLGVAAFADSSATISIDASEEVLQLTVPQTASISLNPITSSGDFDSTTFNITVSTNNETGYTLTMSPNSGDANYVTSLIGDNGSRIDTLSVTEPASTGYTENSFTANKWGYRLTSNSNYYPMPAELAPDSWVTDVNANISTHTLTLAAKVDGAQPTGEYTTTLNFEVVANPRIGKHTIAFNGNGSDGGTAMNNFVVYAGNTENLPQNTYTLTGYRFTGWSTSQSGPGLYYGDEAPYSVSANDYSMTIILYAQWVPNGTPSVDPGTTGVTIARAYEIAYSAMHKGMYEEQTQGQGDYALVNSWPPTSESYKGYDVRFALQDMTTEICNSVTVIEDSYGALDIRDNKIYNIVKLKDGRCWMQDNLRLDVSNSTVKNNLSITNTNVDATTLDKYLNGGGTADDRYPVEGVKRWVWSQNRRVENIPLAYIDHIDDAVYTDPDTGEVWKAGVYYNYCAASAGSYCYNDGKDTDLPDTLSDAEWDICPYGWRLPTMSGGAGGDIGEIADLSRSYAEPGDSSGMNLGGVVAAIHFPTAGSYNGSNPVYSERYFISSTRSGSGSIYSWRMYASYQPYNFMRVWGVPIRCIAK